MKNPIPPDVASQAPAAGAELTHATDELTELLREVEDAFFDWKLGVTASVELGRTDAAGRPLHLRFGKQKGGWGLVVQALADQGDVPKPYPVTLASRDIRVRAAERIPALSHALLDEARRQVLEMHAAIEKVRQFIATLRC